MSHELKQFGQRYQFNTNFIKEMAKELSDEDWNQKHGEANSAYWLLGHIAQTRRQFVRLLQDELAVDDWEEYFKPRSNLDRPDSAPSVEFLLKDISNTGLKITKYLNAISDEDADKELPQTLPSGDNNIRGYAYFLYFHEGYHMGQIGFVRRVAGKPGLR